LKTHHRLCLVALTLLAGCAHADHGAMRNPRPAIDPNAEPAEPEVPVDDRPALNTEYFLGTREQEAAQFAEFARQIQELQRKAKTEHGQPLQRGFHAKSHACLSGELRLDPHRDPRTRFGLFADSQGPKRVVARFSNGVGWRQSDGELDARGLAFKVFGVDGTKYLPDEQDTQDFLMTNSPTPVGRDAVEFMEFARANANGRVAGLFFLGGHASTAAKALVRTFAVDSMVTERYWSGGAYHLGAHQAVKYSTRPCDLRLVREPSRSSDDYLRDDLVLAAKDGVCMTLYVQLQTDPDKTPIENSSAVWEESDSPILPVAKIVMPPQVVEPSATAACDALAFTPWHAIPAHKPMGHINRARRYVYEASQTLRRAQ
jgi:hypothetical protein